jgi:hypothetical protein
MALPPNPEPHPLQRESTLLLAIAIVVVILRCLARIQVTGVRKLRLDDWGMKVALVSDESPDVSPMI